MKRAGVMLLACALSLPAVSSRAELLDGIQAVVHDSVITYEDVEAWTEQTQDTLLRQFRTQPELFRKKMEEARTGNLEKLTERQLILHEFKTAGYNMPETIIDELVQERIKSQFGDRATATKSLQEKGLTYEKFRQQIRDQFIVEAMRQKNISQEIIMSPHRIDAFYQAHKEDYKVEDEVKLRMIVLNKSNDPDKPSARKLAEDILTKLKEGVAFSEMAQLHSEAKQSTNGGSWGWVEKSVLRPELAEVAFKLKPGQLSDVIETPQACYLMLVEEARPAHFKPLNEVRDEIEKTMALQERDRLEKQWIERLRKKTFVRYF